MEPAIWTLVGLVAVALITLVGTRLTGKSAEKVAETNVEARAYEGAMNIWTKTIEHLQRQNGDQETRLKVLEEQAQKNATWRQVAVNHILELHSYMRLHLHRDDIPDVPEELAEDIPPFRKNRPGGGRR